MRRNIAIGTLTLGALGAAIAPVGSMRGSGEGSVQPPDRHFTVVYENTEGMVVEFIDADGFVVLDMGEPVVIFHDDGVDIAAYMRVASVREDNPGD